MSSSMVDGVGIVGMGVALPDTVVTNEDLVLRYGLDVSPEWIERKTGIRSRRVAAGDEATSDLASRAALCALAAAGLTSSDLDGIIVATSTPDRLQPSTACVVQGGIGAIQAFAFDVDAVCSGFVYALATAAALMGVDAKLKHVLVVGAETYSRVLDYGDPTTCTLFGDGAGAVVLGRSAGAAVVSWELGADGTRHSAIGIPAGGSRQRVDAQALAGGMDKFQMDGRAVAEFVLETVPAVVGRVLAEAGRAPADLGAFIPHQANAVLLQEVCTRAGIAPERMVVNVGDVGNLGAASVPVALAHARDSGMLTGPGDWLLVGFGGGLTWAGVLLRPSSGSPA